MKRQTYTNCAGALLFALVLCSGTVDLDELQAEVEAEVESQAAAAASAEQAQRYEAGKWRACEGAVPMDTAPGAVSCHLKNGRLVGTAQVAL